MKKNISGLLKAIGRFEIQGDQEVMITGLSQDSRKIKDGYLFIAIPGTVADGHKYVDQAIKNGAKVILVERWPDSLIQGVTYIRCASTRKAIAAVASAYMGDPSKELKVVGVTGTNGKTTIATMLYNLFKEIGYKVGLISTIEIRIGDDKWETQLTTPDPLTLQSCFREMLETGCQYVFMEVSSHAIDQDRIANIDFDAAVFTNITHDHLDYHGSFKAYIQAKKSFFDGLKPEAFALVNGDDKNGRVMVQNCGSKVSFYGLRSLVDYKGKIISMDASGLYLDINGQKLMSRLIGQFNAYNLLAVYAIADLFDIARRDEILEVLSGLGAVKGRFEVIHQNPYVVIDYAHSPDALENVLKSLRKIHGDGKIITVIGCGGDRDKEKRPAMGKIAVRQSSTSIFTSDNPRSEDPQVIIEDMKKELDASEKAYVLEIVDRAMAIKTALSLANEKDVILIAGKGHEDYQEINGKKRYFSDAVTVKDLLSKNI